MGPLPAAQTLTNISKSDQKAKERCLNLSSKKLNQFESISPVCLSCHGLFMKVSGGFACEHIKIVDTVKCNVHFCPFRSVVQSSDGRSMYIYIYATPPPPGPTFSECSSTSPRGHDDPLLTPTQLYAPQDLYFKSRWPYLH